MNDEEISDDLIKRVCGLANDPASVVSAGLLNRIIVTTWNKTKSVHHKVYFRNKMLWDCPDDCLVTLCESCHHYIHSLSDIAIPIVEDNSVGQAILIGKTQPKPYKPKLNHTDLGTFKPLSLVKENRWGYGLNANNKDDYNRAKDENKKWYEYQDILDNSVVHISYLKSYEPRWNKNTPEEIKKVADFIILDFIENILGFSKLTNDYKVH